MIVLRGKKMHQTINDIRQYFVDELEAERFTVDRSGSKTIELLGASFLADEPAIFGEPNQEYIDAELEWYLSESTNINTLAKIYGKSPVAWQYSANEFGEINSNYGHLVYSDKYFNQFENALAELIKNPDSRRAQMVYNRPSIWVEHDENGKNDFICTNAQTFYIRDNKLHMVSQMRSNDSIFGYKNDYAWAKFLMGRMVKCYNASTRCEETFSPLLEVGDLYWQVMNLHVYGRHFHLVK
jgi:thymidylate synthase